MTTIRLPENLKRFIQDAVSTGQYANEDDVISDALIRLQRSLDSSAETSKASPDSLGSGKRLTKQHFQRHLVKIGLLDEAPGASADNENSAGLLDQGGEIVDEVVIRERLIEWLTGFLNE